MSEGDFHKKIMKRKIIIKTNSKIIIHQTEFSMNLAFYFYMFCFGRFGQQTEYQQAMIK